ncbi:MAG: hypothetical protein ACE5E5_05030 [Phycisphaerae bacterium]
MIRADGSAESPNAAREALAELCAAFGINREAFGSVEFVDPATMPDTFQRLLAHQQHMTATLKAYHDEAVTLQVVAEWQCGDIYSRLIKLCAGAGDHVVEVGVMRFDLAYAGKAVRRAVLECTTPLGDILAAHEVMRRIEPRWFLRLGDAFPLLTHFGNARPAQPGNTRPPAAFARIGRIYCNDHPAIDLLEIVTDQKAEYGGAASSGGGGADDGRG